MKKLGEIITLKRGYDLPSSKRKAGLIPVVSSSGISGVHNISKVTGPGVVTGRYGTLGQVYYINQDFWPLNTSLYVQDFKGNNPRFISYFLEHVLSNTMSEKAAVPGVNRNDLHAKNVSFPGVEIHNAIAGILSNYDDLIENNRRRIQLLEKSARLFYKEWFVHLRFPGHEHVKIIDGVPEGWEKSTAFEVMDILSGGTPKTSISEYWDGDIPFFTPKDTSDAPYVYETEKTLTKTGLEKCNSNLYKKDTIFITARGTVGKIKLAQVPMAMNQSCYALIAKDDDISQLFLYCSLVETIDQFKSRAVGAVFDAIIRDTFKLIPFVVPDKTIISEFTETIVPIFRQIDNLIKQNQKLQQARDILLPRLMNGEITV